jgi:tetratricopeptide (TPR) repeat protein
VIIENIKARAHFLIVLTPSALERLKEPNDWLRREIETAMDEKRNIVPLMLESFDFGSPLVTQALTGKLSTLNKYNGLRIYSEYFFEAMEKLRQRYLNVEVSDIVSLNIEAKGITEVQKTAASEAPHVEKEELTAQEWFERGYVFQQDKNFDEAIRCYREALQLQPDLSMADNNLGVILSDQKRYAEAIEAFRLAISKDPNLGQPYSNLGLLLEEKLKRYEEAEEAYRLGIVKDPNDANAYNNLAIMLHQIGREADAIPIYEKLVTVAPDDFNPYLGIASVKKQLGLPISEEDLIKARAFIPIDDCYNLACLESICENGDLAFEYLTKAAQKDGLDRELAWKDPDLDWIRSDPRFTETVGPPPGK